MTNADATLLTEMDTNTELETRTPAAPQSSAPASSGEPPRIVHLKTVLTEMIDPDYAAVILQEWEDVVARKTIVAVPINDDSFELSFRTLNGPKRKMKVQNELIKMTPEAEAWFHQKAEQARLEIMKNTGKIGVDQRSAQNVDSLDMDLFDQMADLRSQHLTDKRKRKK